MSKLNKLNIAGLSLALFGVVFSIILILEYFNAGGKMIESICSATGDGNGCAKVAQSSYSGIRNVPLLGDLPVALFGFVFYGLISTFFIQAYRTGEAGWARINFGLSFFGLFVDAALAVISVGIIKTICVFCLLTYFVTIGLCIVSYFIAQEDSKKDNVSMKEYITGIADSFQEKISVFTTFALAIFLVGFIVCKSANSGHSHMISDEQEKANRVKKAVSMFDQIPTSEISIEGAPFIGDKNAPVVIVKYADFNCGHCMHASHTLKTILAEYSGLVKIVFKNFPLDGTCNRFVGRQAPGGSSCVAASAALCADKQGKFLPVYTGLFSDLDKGVMHSTGTVIQIAGAENLNLDQFKKCLSSPQTAEFIKKEVEEAGKLQIESTPSIYINNRAIARGTPDIDLMRGIINHLIKRK